MDANAEPNEEQTRAVFAAYGLAVFLAQCVERGLITLLTTYCAHAPLGSAEAAGWTRQDHDSARRAFERRTMGQLLKALAPHLTMERLKHLDGSLGTALDRRNWLAHHYFWQRALDFCTAAGQLKMLRELEDASTLFTTLNTELGAILDEWATAHGVTPAEIAARADAALEEFRRASDGEGN